MLTSSVIHMSMWINLWITLFCNIYEIFCIISVFHIHRAFHIVHILFHRFFPVFSGKTRVFHMYPLVDYRYAPQVIHKQPPFLSSSAHFVFHSLYLCHIFVISRAFSCVFRPFHGLFRHFVSFYAEFISKLFLHNCIIHNQSSLYILHTKRAEEHCFPRSFTDFQSPNVFCAASGNRS